MRVLMRENNRGKLGAFKAYLKDNPFFEMLLDKAQLFVITIEHLGDKMFWRLHRASLVAQQ